MYMYILFFFENYFFILQTSSVVVSCHGHFKISGINRNEEITAVEEQINILEDEVLLIKNKKVLLQF